ncbi:MAG TPA: DUF2325 domain-containing protein, partial [Archaeoglobus sp.]|nr:DUF2325 domain-containing protein [Archaeoglobus sp.]
MDETYKERTEKIENRIYWRVGQVRRSPQEVAKSFWLRALLPQRNGVRADDLKSLVRRCDVVFCPTDINGHNACKIVKRLVNLKGLWWRFC